MTASAAERPRAPRRHPPRPPRPLRQPGAQGGRVCRVRRRDPRGPLRLPRAAGARPRRRPGGDGLAPCARRGRSSSASPPPRPWRSLAREAGRVRGPVVAPVPWVDHVVASSVDRWAALRPWFGYSLFAALFAGGLSGPARRRLVRRGAGGAGLVVRPRRRRRRPRRRPGRGRGVAARPVAAVPTPASRSRRPASGVPPRRCGRTR